MYIQRANHAIIEASIARPMITAIIGPRRVGKSSFILHYASIHPDYCWVFLNMDKMEQRILAQEQQLERLIIEQAKSLIGSGKKIWVIIDEAQKCPAIFDQIKLLYDNYKNTDAIKFIMTGSAILSLHQLSAESLAGRIELYHLYEFNLHEATSLQAPDLPTISIFDHLSPEINIDLMKKSIKQISPFRNAIENQLNKQLIWGGLPELLTLNSDEEKIIYLNNYLQTYLEKDIRDIETISDLGLYRRMLNVTAEQTGSVRDDTKILQALQCKRDTLKKYRGYLESTLFYTEIYPFIGSTLKRLVKSPKGYLLNNGLISILTGLTDLSLLEKTGLIGHRIENWFLNEVNTWLARIPFPTAIHYWRTTSGMEVDFIIEKKPAIFPFEITYSTMIDRKKVSSLLTLMKDEKNAQWGFYIYRGEFHVDEKNKIFFIPCWAF